MILFTACLVLLIVAYFTYGKYLEKVVGIDRNATVPSSTHYNGVDYVPMPRWRTFLIQLLNIAGVGPIFGAILGACYGPVAFLWITLGGIFIGSLHDFVSGVMIVRNDGLSLPEMVGTHLGNGFRQFTRVFTLIVLLLVGVVFLCSPAGILASFNLFGSSDTTISYFGGINQEYLIWLVIIIIYYFVATLVPIDKLIGKIYPVFGAALLFMAVGLLGVIYFGGYHIPECHLANMQADTDAMPIFPVLFISIACGAISGFHGTQTPLMARCIRNEKDSRPVFFGAMISESIIALIWAGVSIAFFYDKGGLVAALAEHGNNAGWVVTEVSNSTLGKIGGILAILGVVAAPITSGDTAFRSVRLTIADVFHINQTGISKRLMLAVPVFAIGIVLAFVDFGIIWRYFSWSNQAMATITLWCIVKYLATRRSNYWLALIPAVFMTYVCTAFIFQSNQFIGMGKCPQTYILGAVLALLITFCFWRKRINGSCK